tara:strand:- start:32 stop:376 length:345 start_codon:yes stop_codon:yes gene_type:complete
MERSGIGGGTSADASSMSCVKVLPGLPSHRDEPKSWPRQKPVEDFKQWYEQVKNLKLPSAEVTAAKNPAVPPPHRHSHPVKVLEMLDQESATVKFLSQHLPVVSTTMSQVFIDP